MADLGGGKYSSAGGSKILPGPGTLLLSTKMGKRLAPYHRSPSHSTILEHHLLSLLCHDDPLLVTLSSCSSEVGQDGRGQEVPGNPQVVLGHLFHLLLLHLLFTSLFIGRISSSSNGH